MAEDFSKNLVKGYKYWEIYVHENQDYLGRCVVWCKRENALDLTDTTPEEQAELFLVFRDLRGAAEKVFQADWFNYAFLGNETRHLHGHFIPRYASEREFGGITFKDERWGGNYQTNHNFKISEDLIEQIRVKIKKALTIIYGKICS